uniref:NECAP PHear domain-containing protein n=1 Tax=Chaetoceros debilis TaxID=122233 RepID=A0A7S3PTX7_9STRA
MIFHRSADDWNLANPLETCSVLVKRVDSSLLIQLHVDRPKPNAPPGATEKYLFAQCKIDRDIKFASALGSASQENKNVPTMEHWVTPVTDSSRYFVIRISDQNSGKEAHIGVGFRERNDALNFKMSLQDYERSMKKESIASASFDDDNDADDRTEDSSNDGSGSGIGPSDLGVSKLSLKEGEKIHVNIKGVSASAKPRKKSIGSGTNGLGFALKKPPPPPSSLGANTKVVEVVNTDSIERNTLTIPTASSILAVASSSDNVEDSEDDDDEWGDFESS